MQYAVVLALAGLAMAAPQVAGTDGAGGPIGSTPAGCSKSYDGNFEITPVLPSNIQNKRALEERDGSTCGQTGYLTLNLKDGNLMDTDGRTGYIASNNSQLQFDKPVQAGGIYAGEFSLCNNGSLALGGSTQFFQCQSGKFYNLYLNNVAPYCTPVNIDILPCPGAAAIGGSAAPSSSAASSVASSAAPASSAASMTGSAAPVSVTTDGQPQATVKASAVPVSVYTDGQPQITAPASSVMPAPVSEYTDGQPQATAKASAAANVTAVAPMPSATIATGSAASMAAPLFLAGVMAFFALL